jgi:hypothetical protein
MPSTSEKQGIPQSVAREFNAADQAKANPNKKKPKLRIGRQTYEGR